MSSQAVKHARAPATQERRDMSLRGVARRAQFDASLDVLRTFGLSDEAIEHYRHLARKMRKLPHELVRDIAEGAAGVAFVLSSVRGRPA